MSAAIRAFLDMDKAGVEALATAIYFGNRGENQYRPDHPNPDIAAKSLRILEKHKEDKAAWGWYLNEARAVLALLRERAE